MKQTKILLLMIVTIATLTLGQSVAVGAIIEYPGSNNIVETPAVLLAGEAFSVDIYFVGTGSTSGQEITAGSDGAYDIVDPNADNNFNLVRIKTNVTGWTCWGGSCADTNTTKPGIQSASSANITAGQLFIIIDGLVSRIGGGFMSGGGADIAIALGTHVVTMLYMGKDGAGTTFWASDTVVIRVSKTADEASLPIEYTTVPLELDITDLALSTTSIESEAAFITRVTSKGVDVWTQQITYDVASNVSLTMDGVDVDPIGTSEITTATTLGLSGVVNSSGFEGFQTEGNYSSTVGQMFLIDAAGLTNLADNPTTATVFNTPFDPTSSQSVELSGTFVGLLTFAEYGRWDDSLSNLYVGDFDSLLGVNEGNNDTDYDFEASFDYIATVDGGRIFDTPSEKTLTSSVTNTETLSSTTTTTENTPGFAAIVSLLALGVIAFVAPRFRRENR